MMINDYAQLDNHLQLGQLNIVSAN